MGTQGFLWRLIFTTGFVGTALFAVFMAIQLARHIRRIDPISVVGCMVLTISGVFFIVYDSLESPLFILMLAIGLMNRQRLEDSVPLNHVPRNRPTLVT
jgi:drug/metabolite transporter (DMT)-like permease